MKDSLKNRIGFILCLSSLIIYCLVKLPLNLSVVCPNHNEGFSLAYGQHFLLSHKLTPGRGPLFVFIYALILQIFGFNTWTIIALHYLQTIVVITIGILLYFILKRALKSDLSGGLATLLWIILISAPIGGSELMVEINSHYALEPEYFCVLFSLLSVLCLLFGDFFKTEKKITKKTEIIFSFLAGLLAVLAFMIKATGAVLLIATALWFISVYLFNEKIIRISKILLYFSGLISGLLLFSAVFYISNGELISSWKDYFLIGSYTREHLSSLQSIVISIFKFMTRFTSSTSNFIIFLITFLFFVWGLIKGILLGKQITSASLLWSFISIWGIGNVCGIIMPGMYQPYYYHLIWPVIAIIFVLGFHQIFSYLKKLNNKPIIILTSLILLAFFIYRVALTIPAYSKLGEKFMSVSVFNQPQSFQDPVLDYDTSLTNRHGSLQVADLINTLTPDKKSTIYIFNFSGSDLSGLTPLTYIYAKRYPPTSIDCNLLKVDAILTNKLQILKEDLIRNHPEILILSGNSYLHPEEVKTMMPFIEWFGSYISDNYRVERTFNITQAVNEMKAENFIIYRKLK